MLAGNLCYAYALGPRSLVGKSFIVGDAIKVKTDVLWQFSLRYLSRARLGSKKYKITYNEQCDPKLQVAVSVKEFFKLFMHTLLTPSLTNYI